jgi:tetratricopeptide (TPR) repeat protein
VTPFTPRARRAAFGGLIVLAALSGSCAYYNTYYLAKKYYNKASAGQPYQLDKPDPAQAGDYQKSIDYSKKVIADYAKSKWVDDAYLMWAQALIGKGDPLQTVSMLQEFSVRFPQSALKPQATFYLGVAYRQARKYRDALVALDDYLAKQPKGDLAPYAHIERARALTSVDRPSEAAEAAAHVIEEFPKSGLITQARAIRGEALLANGQFTAARSDFQALGSHSRDDDERFRYLLREADCLEAARDYTTELSLLNDALSHEPKPILSPSGAAPAGPGADRYGQLMLRIGTVHLLSERRDQALAAYETVISDYPKTNLSAEAQYRIGYAYETAFDDFDRARQEYVKVRDQSMGSAFFAQANTRLASLERLARYRASGDSSGRKVEAGFLLAEQYLFQLDKPDRALEAYQQIERDFPNSPSAAKAINAQAWVLRRKLKRPETADSLLWAVVHDYPATEAQLAARDYLEAEGKEVPVDLIKMPENFAAVTDTAVHLSQPPDSVAPLGGVPPENMALADSTGLMPMQNSQTQPVLIPGATAGGVPPIPLIAPGAIAGGAAARPPAPGSPNPAPPRAGASPASRHDDPPRPPAADTTAAPPSSSPSPPSPPPSSPALPDTSVRKP